jgi:3-deoxy-manno-octulosonate cytidylyltransferase (CMP-KDO synthetase)
VIPARYASTRFPGKPLALISGKPMIQWVYERVSQVRSFDAVIVATDTPLIAETVTAFGGIAEMTDPDHASGTDRVWEVARKWPEAAYIFNIQGDEPLIDPLFLEEAIRFLKFHHESVDIITLKAPIESEREREDSNVVKVVTNDSGQALYFSRSPIPFVREPGNAQDTLAQSFRHVGIYGYQRKAIERFVQLPVSPLEQLEKLEQLRALEAGMRIYAIPVSKAPIGIDTPEDLAVVQAMVDREHVA